MPQICYYIAMSCKKSLNERSRKGLSPAVICPLPAYITMFLPELQPAMAFGGASQ